MENFAFVDLTKKQRRLFNAPTVCMRLVDVDCDLALNALANKQQKLNLRIMNSSVADIYVGMDIRRLDKDIDTFVEIASKVLFHELGIVVQDPQTFD